VRRFQYQPHPLVGAILHPHADGVQIGKRTFDLLQDRVRGVDLAAVYAGKVEATIGLLLKFNDLGLTVIAVNPIKLLEP
jgi:hypothetical protein